MLQNKRLCLMSREVDIRTRFDMINLHLHDKLHLSSCRKRFTTIFLFLKVNCKTWMRNATHLDPAMLHGKTTECNFETCRASCNQWRRHSTANRGEKIRVSAFEKQRQACEIKNHQLTMRHIRHNCTVLLLPLPSDGRRSGGGAAKQKANTVLLPRGDTVISDK